MLRMHYCWLWNVLLLTNECCKCAIVHYEMHFCYGVSCNVQWFLSLCSAQCFSILAGNISANCVVSINIVLLMNWKCPRSIYNLFLLIFSGTMFLILLSPKPPKVRSFCVCSDDFKCTAVYYDTLIHAVGNLNPMQLNIKFADVIIIIAKVAMVGHIKGKSYSTLLVLCLLRILLFV